MKSVVLPDGFAYNYYQCPRCFRVEYSLKQAQALIDYSRDHLFMFVEDWILAWMAVPDSDVHAHVPGITSIQKQMVVVIRDFAAENNIFSENPGFGSYESGPYAERVDRAIETLDDAGYIHSEGRSNTDIEIFSLTDKGIEKGKRLLSRFDSTTLDKLKALKRDLTQFTP